LPTESLWAHPDREAIGRTLLAAATGEQIDPADRDYLVGTVASRTGVSPEEASTRVDQLVEQERAIEAQAREAAERALRASIIAAFLTAAALAIGAAFAYYAATLGGNHRDNETVLEGWYRPW
jgi:DNA-binding IclR family transcriptional regulator